MNDWSGAYPQNKFVREFFVLIGCANILLNVKRFQFVANNINRADFNDRCQSMSNVSPDNGTGQGKVNIQLSDVLLWNL
ncbi:TPA: hypothetical protein GFX53_19380 [Escherichia coli]|jgi:hypothetical protein|nr:hypothetical protein [Escherichia coli]EEW2085042.1 hypothetical protein [Escherichia coli]EEW2302782.1 hypothetical protein [Escherichia coli]EEW2615927.1 hypothetical protein [Escherichia coli]EFB1684787.1 hypothetical protein [Escherichia coli]